MRLKCREFQGCGVDVYIVAGATSRIERHQGRAFYELATRGETYPFNTSQLSTKRPLWTMGMIEVKWSQEIHLRTVPYLTTASTCPLSQQSFTPEGLKGTIPAVDSL
jgi:hypothetical protein